MSNPDLFKQTFKYFKRKEPSPDYNKVIDCNNPEWDGLVQRLPTKVCQLGLDDLVNPKDWEIYKLMNLSSEAGNGIIYIKNPFNCQGHWNWTIRCLKEFSRCPPYENNLKPFRQKIIPSEKLDENPDELDWWSLVQDSSTDLKDKLRWSTLGYHHDWDSKVYSEDKVSEFPLELAELCKFIIKAVPGYENLPYRPEAAIINYYNMDSTIGGHTDHSEPNQDAPLISISFGQSAVFLIGGKHKSVEPLPIFLHSGDVLIMTQESRQSYHGVPRIVNGFSESDLLFSFVDGACENDFMFAKNYLKSHRINMNVRQVH